MSKAPVELNQHFHSTLFITVEFGKLNTFVYPFE